MTRKLIVNPVYGCECDFQTSKTCLGTVEGDAVPFQTVTIGTEPFDCCLECLLEIVESMKRQPIQAKFWYERSKIRSC